MRYECTLFHEKWMSFEGEVARTKLYYLRESEITALHYNLDSANPTHTMDSSPVATTVQYNLVGLNSGGI